MDDQRTGDAAITGVARGSLGTGTALEDTQEWVIEDLQAPPEPAGAAAAERADAAAPVPATRVEPEPARPPVARRSPRAGGPSPRTAGIAAAALLALVGVAAVVTSLGGTDTGTVPQVAPSAAVQVTAGPTVAPPAEADEGGNGDKGKGNGKGNGNGNGNGND